MTAATARDRLWPLWGAAAGLAGFTAVYDGEAAMTFDEFNKQATTPTALEKQLQDRAEQLRQQMGTEGGATPPAEAPAAPQ